jgi:hypothetical protein
MVFRDDSAGIMNAMWALYMSSYVQDRLNPESAFSKTNLRPGGESRDNFRYGLDKAGGGLNLAAGAVYVKTNEFEDNGSDSTPRTADYKIYRRISTGATIIRSDKITTQITAGTKTFTIQESITGQLALNSAVTVSFTSL